MYPNTILYQKGSNLDYYLNRPAASETGHERHIYVVYMNGMVSRLRKSAVCAIEPGCEIIVPSKEK